MSLGRRLRDPGLENHHPTSTRDSLRLLLTQLWSPGPRRLSGKWELFVEESIQCKKYSSHGHSSDQPSSAEKIVACSLARTPFAAGQTLSSCSVLTEGDTATATLLCNVSTSRHPLFEPWGVESGHARKVFIFPGIPSSLGGSTKDDQELTTRPP